VFRLAELADPPTSSRLSLYGRREACPRANANGAQCSPHVIRGFQNLGEDAKAQIPYQKTEWEMKIQFIS